MINSNFSEDGHWWLPQKPENKISGKLEFDPENGASLTLFGSFNEGSAYSLILGSTESGAEYTLEEATNIHTVGTAAGYLKIIISFSMIYKGHLYQNSNEILFDKISLNFSNLNDWLDSNQFGYTSEKSKDAEIIKIIKILPQKRKLINIPNATVEIFCSSSGTYGTNNISIKKETGIVISSQTPLKFFDFYEQYIHHFQNYLSLGLGKPVYPLEVIGFSNKLKESFPDDTEQPKKITIYTQFYSYPKNFPQIYPFNRLYSYNDIKEKFEISFNLWLTQKDLLKPVFDLYFGTLYNDKLYIQSKFLNLTQALESYHRRKYGGTYVDNQKNSEISNILMAAVPSDIESDFKDSIRGRLKYINEFSQRKRLKELIRGLQEKYGAGIIKYLENTDQFIDDVINTRNYNTHFDESLKKSAKDGFELFVLTEKIKFLLEICFLSEIGLSAIQVIDLITRTNRYQFLTSYRQWNP